MSNPLIQILQKKDLIHCYDALSRYDEYKLNDREIIQLQEMLKPLIIKTNTYCIDITLSKRIILGKLKENWEQFLAALEKRGDKTTLEIANKVSKRYVMNEMEGVNTLNEVLKTATLSQCYAVLSTFESWSQSDLEEFRKFLPSLFHRTENFVSTLSTKKVLQAKTMKNNFQDFLNALKAKNDNKTIEAVKNLKQLWETMDALFELNNEKKEFTSVSAYTPIPVVELKEKSEEVQSFEKLQLEKSEKSSMNLLQLIEEKSAVVLKEKSEEKTYSFEKLQLEKTEGSSINPLNVIEKKSAMLKEKLKEEEIHSFEKLQFEKLEKSSINPLKPLDDVLLDFKLHTTYTIPHAIAKYDLNINAVGIDLGTSRCCVAVNRKNGIETIALDNRGERLLPSYISFDESHAKCGRIVVDRLRNYAEYTIFDSKRLIGRTLSEVKIEPSWPFTVSDDGGLLFLLIKGPNSESQILKKESIEKSRIQPVQVAAALLKYMKQKAEEFKGKYLEQAIITVPAVFTTAQKKAIAEAALLAGWKRVQLLPEPIAAAFAYFIDDSPPRESSRVLVFDLGGGTLDVCIFNVHQSQIKVVSYSGDPDLGGNDFDNILMNYFGNLLDTNYNITINGREKYRLLLECQKIKEDLSVINRTEFDVNDFAPNVESLIKLTREEFEKMTQPLLNRIRTTINSALYSAEHKTLEIDKVLQVGGGSRMPMVKDLLRTMFPNAEHCAVQNPDEVVAIGAAYYAYSTFSSEPETVSKETAQKEMFSSSAPKVASSPFISSNFIKLVEDEETKEIRIAE